MIRASSRAITLSSTSPGAFIFTSIVLLSMVLLRLPRSVGKSAQV